MFLFEPRVIVLVFFSVLFIVLFFMFLLLLFYMKKETGKYTKIYENVMKTTVLPIFPIVVPILFYLLPMFFMFFYISLPPRPPPRSSDLTPKTCPKSPLIGPKKGINKEIKYFASLGGAPAVSTVGGKNTFGPSPRGGPSGPSRRRRVPPQKKGFITNIKNSPRMILETFGLKN